MVSFLPAGAGYDRGGLSDSKLWLGNDSVLHDSCDLGWRNDSRRADQGEGRTEKSEKCKILSALFGRYLLFL